MTDENTTTVVHWRKESHDVYIGRDKRNGEKKHMNNTPIGERGWLGNPYEVEKYGREESIRLFKKDFYDRLYEDSEFQEAVEQLKGKTLGCWCKPSDCHGDKIAKYLDYNSAFDW